MHLVGFIIRIYHDAWSFECQISQKIVLVQVKKPKYVVSWISHANNIVLYHFVPSGILFRRFFTCEYCGK